MRFAIVLLILQWCAILKPIYALRLSSQRISINGFNRISIPSMHKQHIYNIKNDRNSLRMTWTKVKEELKTKTEKNVTNLHHANAVGDSSDQVT